MNVDEFRRVGHELIGWIADYREKAQRGELPVMSRSAPGEIAKALPGAPPEKAESFDAVMRDLNSIILPGCTQWQDPRFFGFFPSNHSLAAVLGDYVSTGLAQLGLNWQSSPALTELEEVTVDWLRQMLGLTSSWSGVIQDAASTGSLVALVCARERATHFGATGGGMQASDRPLMIYFTGQSHSSIEKAAALAGFGRDNLREVEVDSEYAMRPDALEKAVLEDLARGLQPCAVVATSGTTAATAFDPLKDVAKIAQANGMWMHVDAAMAGSAMVAPECRALWDGVEGADSLVVNPHKWLGVAFDCSTYFVRDPQHLVRVMSTNPSYLRTSADSQVKNYRDWGIPLGRRFRALKLWFLIRDQGVSGLRARIRRDLENAQWLKRQVESTPEWKVVAPVRLQTVCIRHEPPGLTGDGLDAHTLAWARQVNESGRGYLSPAILDGQWMVRISIGAEATERHHVADLWKLARRLAERR